MGSTKLKRQQMRIHDEAVKEKRDHVSHSDVEGVREHPKGRKGRKHGDTQYAKHGDLEFTGGSQ